MGCAISLGMWPFSSKKKGISFPPPVPEALRAPLPMVPRRVTAEDIRRATGIEERDVPMVRPRAFGSAPPVQEFFLRAAPYQQLLKLTDQVRDNVLLVEQTSIKLAQSDYNEDKHFEQLKSDLRSMNKQLVAIDKIFFKE